MASSLVSDREPFWRQLIKRRAMLQLSVNEICEQAGVSPASFFYWQKKLRTNDRPPVAKVASRMAPLVPVHIVEDGVAELTVELPRGLRVRVPQNCDEVLLQRVLRAALAACREQTPC